VKGDHLSSGLRNLKDQPGNEATGELGDDVYPDLRVADHHHLPQRRVSPFVNFTILRRGEPAPALWSECSAGGMRAVAWVCFGQAFSSATAPLRERVVIAIRPIPAMTSHAGPGNLCICVSTSSKALRNHSASSPLMTNGGSSLMTST
jgi:hypothetical protein